MHGYALVKHNKQVSDELLQVEEGSLYPAVQRMLMEAGSHQSVGKEITVPRRLRHRRSLYRKIEEASALNRSRVVPMTR
jgi:DNA-binding PadR family transcriptional regulator